MTVIARRVAVLHIAPAPTAMSTATLRYDPADPYAVKLILPDVDCEVSWEFARDLLQRGLYEHAGLGDVRVWPAGQRVMVMISSPEGWLLLSLDASLVRDFVRATYRVMPVERESADADVNRFLNELFGSQR